MSDEREVDPNQRINHISVQSMIEDPGLYGLILCDKTMAKTKDPDFDKTPCGQECNHWNNVYCPLEMYRMCTAPKKVGGN